MVSHVDVVDVVELSEVLSPVACGGGRRGRVCQRPVEDMSIRMILDRESDVLHDSMVATKISIDFPGCVHINLGCNQTPSLRHIFLWSPAF